MKTKAVGPDPEPDVRLDPLRVGLGRLYDESVFVGFLSTRVVVRRTQVRSFLGRALLVDPVEFVEWFFEMVEDWPKRHPDGWDDGWEDHEEVRNQLLAGEFVYPDGAPLRVAWVDASEAAVWAKHYAFKGGHGRPASD